MMVTAADVHSCPYPNVLVASDASSGPAGFSEFEPFAGAFYTIVSKYSRQIEEGMKG